MKLRFANTVARDWINPQRKLERLGAVKQSFIAEVTKQELRDQKNRYISFRARFKCGLIDTGSEDPVADRLDIVFGPQ